MDFRQWRSNHQKQSYHSLADSAPLPLYAPEPNKNSNITTAASQAMSAFTESTPSRLPWLGGYFSLAQWQELELQALIYKYIMAGASVPLELILPLKRNLLNASAYYHHHSQQYQHFQPSTLQSGYWGRYAIDPEPGRCRRTDGKKWRCSRDVVSGQKYCERHVHRGRNRSRKLVEVPKSIQSSGLKATALPSPFLMIKDTHLTQSKASPPPTILPHNQRPPEETSINGYLEGSFRSNLTAKELQGEKPDGRLLRRFFDDWPRSEQDSTIKGSNMSTEAAVTNLSISIPGNCPSDFSLKLSTGICSSNFNGKNADGRVLLLTENLSSWGSQGEASMGGPLAEALRSSSASTPSPTSVLCKPNGSMSETSSIST